MFKGSKNCQVVSERVALLFLIFWSLSWSLTPVVVEHGRSLIIPPHFDGNNYAYWKVRMKAFLKSIDERVWNFVEYGWEKPTTPVSEWKLLKKKQLRLIARLWMLYLMLFLWKNLRESLILRLLILHGIFSKLCMKAQRQLRLQTAVVNY